MKEILKKTGFEIPNPDRVEREALTLELPELPRVRVVISRAREREPGCPLHINIHGGGFILPHSRDDDLYSAAIAVGIRGIVVDIDYATTPGHTYPTALDQCYAVTKWAFSRCADWGADTQRVSIGGHSAGGNLAAVISLKAAQTKDFRLCMQVLDCAMTDNTVTDDTKGIWRPLIRIAAHLYTGGKRSLLKDPMVSPVYAPDEMLRGQPDTLFIAPVNCPFLEANRGYATRLEKAGCRVIYREFENCRHGFTVRRHDRWRSAQDTIINALRG